MPRGREPRRLSAVLIRRIERYRSTSPLANAGVCRFDPSCSHYAEDLLRTRMLAVALPLIAWRLLRCNPFMSRVADDPVRRPRRRLRPNSLPTLFSVLALSGIVVVVTAGVAEAVGVSGGCTATMNGQDPATLTADDPLEVEKGETVSVTGTAPAGTKASDTSVTHIDVAVIDGLFDVQSSDYTGKGPDWGGEKNVDDYLKYGVGLYHVTGVADGSSGWHCEGDGYVELKDGNPLTKPVGAGAAALFLIGGGGAVLAARSKPSSADYDMGGPPFMEPPRTEEEVGEDVSTAAVVSTGPDAGATFGCLVLVILAAFFSGLATDGALFAAASQAATNGKPGRRRFWSHGHPIAGFISGLVAGLGITVLLQQFAVWPLDIVTAIVFPLVVAVLCGLRAYLGKAYTVTTR